MHLRLFKVNVCVGCVELDVLIMEVDVSAVWVSRRSINTFYDSRRKKKHCTTKFPLLGFNNTKPNAADDARLREKESHSGFFTKIFLKGFACLTCLLFASGDRKFWKHLTVMSN